MQLCKVDVSIIVQISKSEFVSKWIYNSEILAKSFRMLYMEVHQLEQVTARVHKLLDIIHCRGVSSLQVIWWRREESVSYDVQPTSDQECAKMYQWGTKMSKGAAGNWIKLVSSDFLGPNCDLKVMMSPCTKIFSWKTWHNFIRFWRKKNQISRVLW